MNGRMGILSILLLVQLALIGLFWTNREEKGALTTNLLNFTPADVTELRITEGHDAEAQTLELQRNAQGWTVAQMPVDEGKLKALLDRLAALNSPWPVATTEQAQERFEVTDASFQKRIQLFAGETEVATLLLGTSPGFKRIHARRPGDDHVYSIALTSLDLPVAAADWINKGLLAADLQVHAISREGQWEAVLQSAAEDAQATAGWSLRSLSGGAAAADDGADPTKLQTLVNRFSQLQIIGPAEVSDGKPADVFELRDAAGQTLRYELYVDAEQERFSMTRDGISGRYEVAAYIAEQMRLELPDLMLLDTDAQSPTTAAEHE